MIKKNDVFVFLIWNDENRFYRYELKILKELNNYSNESTIINVESQGVYKRNWLKKRDLNKAMKSKENDLKSTNWKVQIENRLIKN